MFGRACFADCLHVSALADFGTACFRTSPIGELLTGRDMDEGRLSGDFV